MDNCYCKKCKKEVLNDIKECECEGKSFVFGSVKINEHGNFSCECGSEKLIKNTHMDFPDKYQDNLVCAECQKSVGIETYRSEEDMKYWT